MKPKILAAANLDQPLLFLPLNSFRARVLPGDVSCAGFMVIITSPKHKRISYIHLSAGELLRQERESGSSDGNLIDEYIREGRIVPVAISLGLLRKAMEESAPFSRFLIDGFPRNSDNVQVSE